MTHDTDHQGKPGAAPEGCGEILGFLRLHPFTGFNRAALTDALKRPGCCVAAMAQRGLQWLVAAELVQGEARDGGMIYRLAPQAVSREVWHD